MKNVGTDVLNITALNFGNGVFSTELNAFVLQPGKAQTLVIQAKPSTSGDLKSTLEISSNDEKNPVSQVELKVTGISPPSLSFDLKVSLSLLKKVCRRIVTSPFTILVKQRVYGILLGRNRFHQIK